jgi:hypothetical protein
VLPMAREIALAVLAAAACMAVISGFMFAPRSTAPATERVTFAPEDIRFKLQQADAKKKRKPTKPAPEAFAPAGTTSSGGGDISGDGQEEPSEENQAEEPPIE